MGMGGAGNGGNNPSHFDPLGMGGNGGAGGYNQFGVDIVDSSMNNNVGQNLAKKKKKKKKKAGLEEANEYAQNDGMGGYNQEDMGQVES